MSQLLGGASQCKHVTASALLGVNHVLVGGGARPVMDPQLFNSFKFQVNVVKYTET